jgi:hypothetical protein
VKDIRRAARRHSSVEEKIRIVLEGPRGQEFIAAFAQHISGKQFQMVPCYGVVFSQSSGVRDKAGLFAPGDEPSAEASTPDVTLLDISGYPAKTQVLQILTGGLSRSDKVSAAIILKQPQMDRDSKKSHGPGFFL